MACIDHQRISFQHNAATGTITTLMTCGIATIVARSTTPSGSVGKDFGAAGYG